MSTLGPDQDLEALAVGQGLEASDVTKSERLDDPARPDVEGGDRDAEGRGGEPLPAEIQPGADGLPSEASAGQVGAQAAAGVEGRGVVRPAGDSAVRAEGAEAEQRAVPVDEGVEAVRGSVK